MDEDKKTVQKVIQGDKKAFEMIIHKYQQSLLNYIQRMVGERETALDFTQDVLVKTYYSLGSYRPQYKFKTWLFKIASNYVIDYFRKKRINVFSFDQKKEQILSFSLPHDDHPVVKKIELAELRNKIELALEKVPPELRELFVWRHINELSYQEIAEIKDLPLGTVKNKVFQAKEMIRRLLEKSL